MFIGHTEVEVRGEYSDLNREISRLAQLHLNKNEQYDYRLLAMFGFVSTPGGFVCHFCGLPWTGDTRDSHPKCYSNANVPFSRALFEHVASMKSDEERSKYLDTLTSQQFFDGLTNGYDIIVNGTPLWMFLHMGIYTRDMPSKNFFHEFMSEDCVAVSFTANGYMDIVKATLEASLKKLTDSIDHPHRLEVPSLGGTYICFPVKHAKDIDRENK